MRTLTWERDRIITEIRERIWLYLSASTQPADLALDAAGLLQLTEANLITLARIYLLLSDEVGTALDRVPYLLRRLPTTSAYAEDRSTERVRGAIQWQPTLLARYATGLRNLYVTVPTQRAFQTPENELLVFVLSVIARLSEETGWPDTGHAGRLVAERNATAARWLANRMLGDIEARPPTPRDVARVRTGRNNRRFRAVLAAYEMYQSLFVHLEVAQLQKVIEAHGLVIQPDGVLFEILCLFRTFDALADLGWRLPNPRVFQGGLHCRCEHDSASLDLWYQSTPSALGKGSVYVRTLQSHGFGHTSDLRPDIVLRLTNSETSSWLLLEAKSGRRRGVADSARAALTDLLGYRSAFANTLEHARPPFGLGVAWGADLEPVDQPIMLCTPDRLVAALRLFLRGAK
jgi:hypothetical protein